MGGKPPRGGRWRRGGRRAGEGTVWRAPRSKKKAPDGRTRALLALAQPVPVLASQRCVWESGAGCGLGGSYTSVRAESLGGSGVIGLTWGGGTFPSFIGKFPLSSPPPPARPPFLGV